MEVGFSVVVRQWTIWSSDAYSQWSICLVFHTEKAHSQRFRTPNTTTINGKYQQIGVLYRECLSPRCKLLSTLLTFVFTSIAR